MIAYDDQVWCCVCAKTKRTDEQGGWWGERERERETERERQCVCVCVCVCVLCGGVCVRVCVCVVVVGHGRCVELEGRQSHVHVVHFVRDLKAATHI
jgi:hypothetical protein